VKNNLQVLASLLRLQADQSRHPGVKRALEEAVSRISVMATLHAQLHEGHDRVRVDMKPFVTTLVENLRRTLAHPSAAVRLSLRLDAFSLPIALATPCGLLINEMVTNAFRHAFPGSTPGTIEVKAGEDAGVVTIAVRDSGPGLPGSARLESKSFGLRLIQLLATRQLRGHVSITNLHGVQWVVRFPTRSRGVDASGTAHPRDDTRRQSRRPPRYS